MIDTLVNAFRTPEIRRKLFFVAAMLVVFRLLSHVPVPGADPAALSNFFKDNALFGLLDLFSGGAAGTGGARRLQGVAAGRCAHRVH